MSLDEMLNQFQPEEVPENVYDADKFAPRFQPGTNVRFLFRFEQDESKQVTLSDDKKVVMISFQAQALAVVGKDGDEQPVPAQANGEQPTLRFQNVDSRQFTNADGTLVPSTLHKLFRALVGRDAARLTGTDPRLIIAKLRELDGRETFVGKTGWKFFDADTVTEYSTRFKKSKEFEKRDGTTGRSEPWPMVDGEFAKMVNGNYPRDFVQTFIEKKVAAVTEQATMGVIN